VEHKKKKIRSKVDVSGLHKLFGDNVRTFRRDMEWSQEELAEYVGVSKNTIHDIETGNKFVKAQTLVLLTDVFHIEPFVLFLPPKIKNINFNKMVAKFANNVKESADILMNDFIKNSSK